MFYLYCPALYPFNLSCILMLFFFFDFTYILTARPIFFNLLYIDRTQNKLKNIDLFLIQILLYYKFSPPCVK